MHVQLKIAGAISREFRILWGMTVVGFDSSKHCKACFIGTKYPMINPEMTDNAKRSAVVDLELKEGVLFYVCGVAHSFRHVHNFHLAGVAKPGAACDVKTWEGNRVQAVGLEQISIEAGPAKKMFPKLGPVFVKCRNFQFGCQMFGVSAVGAKTFREQPSLF